VSESTNKISLNSATFLVIANMIGTGVFTSLFFQVGAIHSGFALLMLWIFGGLAALCGSLVYSELATRFPRSGGEYNLLTEIYHPAVGFVSGWISITVGFAAPVAVNSMILGEYVHGVYPDINPLKIGIAVVIIISIIHSISVKFGSQFQNVFTILKLVLIVILIAFGFILGNKQHYPIMPNSASLKDMLSMPFAISLIFVSYAFSGWNAASYFASEIKNPKKNIPKAMVFGTLIVTVLYFLLNYTFLQNIPFAEIGKPENADTGLIAAINIFGVKLGKIYGVFFSLALVASISSMIFAGPRVTQVMGEDYKFFSFAAIKNNAGAPYVATLVQMTISLLLMLTSSYGDIFTFIGFTLSLITLATVVGIFVIRFKNKNVGDNYKVWGYPVVPIIFIGLSLWMIHFTIVGNTKVSLIGFGTALSGLLFYYFSPKKMDNINGNENKPNNLKRFNDTNDYQ
jgi:APA family basic amino acid/polyamine antiporter